MTQDNIATDRRPINNVRDAIAIAKNIASIGGYSFVQIPDARKEDNRWLVTLALEYSSSRSVIEIDSETGNVLSWTPTQTKAPILNQFDPKYKIGQRVKFILGNIAGQIVDIVATGRSSGKPLNNEIFIPIKPQDENRFQTEQKRVEWLEEQLVYKYSIRLSSGAIIRELQDWEIIAT